MLWLVALFVMVFSSLPYVFLVMALITMVLSSLPSFMFLLGGLLVMKCIYVQMHYEMDH